MKEGGTQPPSDDERAAQDAERLTPSMRAEASHRPDSVRRFPTPMSPSVAFTNMLEMLSASSNEWELQVPATADILGESSRRDHGTRPVTPRVTPGPELLTPTS